MSRHNEATPQTIEEYIAMQPEKFKPMLHELYNVIKSLAPQATESISYQVPSSKYYYMLVGFGVTKDFCSLYTMSSDLTKRLKDELKDIKVTGSTLHFVPQEPLPVNVIEKVVMTRMQENEIKFMNK
jgi:uncharacterized protein YdhG (YjbR/CyaY superfamily)